MSILTEIIALELPADAFIVLGSGIMGALGIRENKDIDLLVTPELFESLQKSGWEYSVVVVEGKDRERLRQNKVEAFKDFWYGNGQFELRLDTIQPTIIEGIPFLPLMVLREVKKKMGRPKDFNDIVLIDDYLKNHKAP